MKNKTTLKRTLFLSMRTGYTYCTLGLNSDDDNVAETVISVIIQITLGDNNIV
jgi:hypothetical protein